MFVFVFHILTSIIHPIRLNHKLVLARSITQKILKKKSNCLAEAFRENSNKIDQASEENCKHIRLQQGLETIYQLAISVILLFYAQSKTKTSQGLSGLFEADRIYIMGISVSPTFVITTNVVINFLSFTNANINGIRRSDSHFPIISKFMLATSILCACIARIMSMVLYFAPVLGLFDLLFHYKGL